MVYLALSVFTLNDKTLHADPLKKIGVSYKSARLMFTRNIHAHFT